MDLREARESCVAQTEELSFLDVWKEIRIWERERERVRERERESERERERERLQNNKIN